MRLSTISTTLFAALLLVLVLPAQAQFDTEWERTSRDGAAEPTPSWFGTSTERNVAYGVVGGQERLYVASRSGDVNRIRVIDPDTGADLDDVVISTDGISGGAVAFNTIDVSDDGQIIVSNLVSPSGLFKVYAWEDESAEPREIISSELDVRAGDNIHISGSIADGTAAVYAAASNVNRVFRWLMVEDPENAGQYVFQADPQDFTLASITAWGSPGYAVGKDAGEAAFLAGGRSVTFMREYDNEATTTGYVEFAEGNQNIGSAEYVTIDEREFVATYHPTIRQARLHEMAGEPGGTWTNRTGSTYGLTPEEGPTTQNTYGDLSVRMNEDGTLTVFVLATDNGLSAYTTTESFSAVLEPLPLADIRELPAGSEVIFDAVVNRARGDFTTVQDTTAGITIRQTSGAFADSVASGAIREGTMLRVHGVTSEYAQLLQINEGGLVEWEILSQDNPVEPTVVTLQEIAENGEQYESMLVRVDQLETSTTDETWSNGTNYAVSDPTLAEGTVALRVPNASDNDVAGLPIPGGTFTFEGRLGQFNFDDPTAGYQLLIVEQKDIFIPPTLLDDPEWMIAAGDTPWFVNDNNTRGGDYNPATDHLLVASRSGGLQIQVVHPANGQEIGLVDVEGVSGGTFPLNEISVTEDGQIFGANLVIAEGAEVRVYRWADEDAAPEVVFAGALEGPRYGDSFHVSGSGDDVRIYVSGSGNDRVAMLTWDGTDVSEPSYIIAEEGVARARLGIFQVPGQDSLWVNGAGTPLTKIGLDGGIGREIPEEVLPGSFGDIYFFEWNDRFYVLTGPDYGADHSFLVVDVTDPGEERVAYQTMALGEDPNLNGVGFATADWKRGNIIVGATNNAIAAFSLQERDNTAPSAVAIVAPSDGAEITIEGDPETEFTAAWESATDAQGDPVLYRWQLSATSDFAEPLLDVEAGTDTSFTTNFGSVAALMDAAEVTNLQVYHRVITSDGELEAIGEASSVTLIRGTLTDIETDSQLPRAFALHGNYPNPFNPTTNIRFDLPEAADVRVEVYDMLGRQVMTLAGQSFQAGTNHSMRIDASGLASGTYLYRVVADMKSMTRVETGKMLLVK